MNWLMRASWREGEPGPSLGPSEKRRMVVSLISPFGPVWLPMISGMAADDIQAEHAAYIVPCTASLVLQIADKLNAALPPDFFRREGHKHDGGAGGALAEDTGYLQHSSYTRTVVIGPRRGVFRVALTAQDAIVVRADDDDTRSGIGAIEQADNVGLGGADALPFEGEGVVKDLEATG